MKGFIFAQVFGWQGELSVHRLGRSGVAYRTCVLQNDLSLSKPKKQIEIKQEVFFLVVQACLRFQTFPANPSSSYIKRRIKKIVMFVGEAL